MNMHVSKTKRDGMVYVVVGNVTAVDTLEGAREWALKFLAESTEPAKVIWGDGLSLVD
jgi:hypothetical protein